MLVSRKHLDFKRPGASTKLHKMAIHEMSQGPSCPACKQGMAALRHGDTEIDVCRSCTATWLDSGEDKGLHQLIKSRAGGGAPGSGNDILADALSLIFDMLA